MASSQAFVYHPSRKLELSRHLAPVVHFNVGLIDWPISRGGFQILFVGISDQLLFPKDD